MAGQLRELQKEELRRFIVATVAAMQAEALLVPPTRENVAILSDIGKTVAGLKSLLENLPS